MACYKLKPSLYKVEDTKVIYLQQTGEANFSTFAAGMVASAASSAGKLAGGFAASSNGTMATGFVSGGLAASITGGNFWAGAVTGLTVAALNHTMHNDFNTTGSFRSTAKPPLFPTIFALKMLGMTVLARIAQLTSGSPIFPTAYTHFQFGNNQPLHIPASSLDFSKVKKNDIDRDENGNLSLNLIDIDLFNQSSIVIGKIGLNSLGNDRYSFKKDTYDFNIETRQLISKRNALTVVAGALHYGYGFPLLFGGTYDIYVDGVIIIH